MRKTSLVPKLVALLGSATASPLLTTATAAAPAPTPWTEVRGPDVEAPAVVSLGGSRVLVGAGFAMNGSGCLQNMSIYDAASNTWSASTPLPDGWFAPAMASLGDGAVLASGGQSYTGSASSSSATVFSADSQKWTKVGSMAVERMSHGMATLDNGAVLAAGGFEDDSRIMALSSCEVFEMKSGSWRTVAKMNSPRFAFALVGLSDGRALACGGLTTNPDNGTFILLDSAEIYNPKTNDWTVVSAMSTPRTDAAASILPDGRVLVAGGGVTVPPSPNYVSLSSAEVYDPTSDSWSAVDPMPEAQMSFGAALTDDGVVLAGGVSALSTALIFRTTKYSCSGDKGCYASPTGVASLEECESFCRPTLYTCAR